MKIENGQLTSIKDGAVFFQLEKESRYGFEDELRIIANRIMSRVAAFPREERLTIRQFLAKLGVKRASPYQIIENYILPVYENGDWRHKDLQISIGYTRYIKDHIKSYERESKNRLETEAAPAFVQDPLERLKEAIVIYTNKKSYEKPQAIYLSRDYGNKNNLEKLFEGIDVAFVNSCYIEHDLKLFLKRKGSKLSEQEKNAMVQSWKQFFLKIGVQEGLRVLECSDSYLSSEDKIQLRKSNTSYSNWYNPSFQYTSEITQDYTIEFLDEILVKGGKDRIKCLAKLLEKQWPELSRYTNLTYRWQYYNWYSAKADSTWLRLLKTTAWIPTTWNTLARPGELFVDKPEIRQVLGDTVPYVALEFKNNDLIETLGINTQANAKSVLNYLRTIIEEETKDKRTFEKIYEFLDEHFEEDEEKIKEEFAQNFLIFVPSSERSYYNSTEVIWRDVSNIFGANRVYLEKHYPKLKDFFLKKLGVSEKPTPRDYANVLCTIAEKKDISEEDKKVIVRIYEELSRNLDPEKVENPVDQEDWWKDFIEKRIFFTHKNEFWRNDGTVFIKDNDEICQLFSNEAEIAFLWLPKGYHPEKIKYFIKTCNLRYFSKVVDVIPLLGQYSKDNSLTELIQRSLPYMLRYLYWTENSTYEDLKHRGILETIGAIEVYVTKELEAEYLLKIDEQRIIKKKKKTKCLYYNGQLYVCKDMASIYDIAVEFSKVLGEIRGLEDFLMNILSKIEDVERIMLSKGIGQLPESERKFLSQIVKAARLTQEGKEKTESKTMVPEAKKAVTDTDKVLSTLRESQKVKEIVDEEPVESVTIVEEKTWFPNVETEKTRLVIEPFVPGGETSERIDRSRKEKAHFIDIPVKDAIRTAERLSEKAKKDIGREGEKYALYCIIKEKLEEYFGIVTEDEITFEDLSHKYPHIIFTTEKGFRLEKDGNVLCEIIWLNKDGESGEHYDIKLIENGEEFFIEVKTTKTHEKSRFEVSREQWRLMQDKGDRFYIYRVYGIGTENVKAEKIPDPAKLWKDGFIEAYPVAIEL